MSHLPSSRSLLALPKGSELRKEKGCPKLQSDGLACDLPGLVTGSVLCVFLRHTFHLLGMRVLSPLIRKAKGGNLGEATRRRITAARAGDWGLVGPEGRAESSRDEVAARKPA